jgi:hypothetical protein
MIELLPSPFESWRPWHKLPRDQQKIWRYMDFAKFVSMLKTSALFFCLAENFDDEFEGSFTFANLERRKLRDYDVSNETEFNRSMKSEFSLNCWHMNDGESAAMWDIYSAGDKAIAITSTYGRLRAALSKQYVIGAVNYIDYTTDIIPEGRVYTPFFHKRKSFAHENELRVLASGHTEGASIADGGLYASVDLSDLITAVYVSPKSPGWYREVVEEVVRRFGLIFSVQQSSMDASAIF